VSDKLPPALAYFDLRLGSRDVASYGPIERSEELLISRREVHQIGIEWMDSVASPTEGAKIANERSGPNIDETWTKSLLNPVYEPVHGLESVLLFLRRLI